MEYIRVYKLDYREDMIDLAKYIQTRVYWGGQFWFNDELAFRWKDFWDIIGVETEGRSDIKGVSIQEGPCIVRLVYKGEDNNE